MELGIIGLGKIGGNLALNALDNGIRVVGKDVSEKKELKEKGVHIVDGYAELSSALTSPRVIYLSLPAGRIIDKVITEIVPFLDKEDVLLDGGNSYFRDSMRREKELREKGIYFLDCGTSGGYEGAREGACFMIGGQEKGFEIVKPILEKLSVKGGLLYTGKSGSGHYTKLVHNGIEFGMLQAIGEGAALLEESEFDLDLEEIFNNWSHGSVIRGWLIELMKEGLGKKELEKIPDYVEDTGEVNWLIHESIESEVPVPVITQSIIELFKSRQKENHAAKAVSLMRHGFGGHPFGKDEYIARERKEGRIGKI